MTNNSSPLREIHPTPLTEKDQFWLDTTRGAVKDAIPAFEEAAKQMIGVTTLAQTIYFAAISFSDVQKSLSALDITPRIVFALALVAPIVIWVISLLFAVLVFKPEVYQTNLDSPDLAEETYYKIAAYKHRMLQGAHIFLVIGFVILIAVILIYLILIPAPKS